MEAVKNEWMAKELISLVPLLHKAVFHCASHEGCFPLPPKQMQTLMMLSFSEKMSMTQLTERVGVSKQQLAQLVDALVERGLVSRAGSEENRRLVLIELTHDGHRLIQDTVREKSIEIEELFTGFTQAERETVVEAARLVKRALKRKLGVQED